VDGTVALLVFFLSRLTLFDWFSAT